jgi:chromosome segregation ATPase
MGSTTELLTWVREGELLFGAVVGVLQQHEPLQARVATLELENQNLREELQAMRAELEFFRTERIEAAETLKAIAEHVTRLATVALQRLGKPVAELATRPATTPRG